jgi:ATP-dependent helicase HepA
MTKFNIGQRWISETEPELGLGIIESVERHQIRLAFKSANEVRLYASDHAPVKRVKFCEGDTIQTQDGTPLVIETVREENGLRTYVGGGVEVPEALLADSTSFSKPEDRLIVGQTDPSSSFTLRYEAMKHQYEMLKSDISGFVGGRIDLIPHQLYIAERVANRYVPRVLLSDEVGLGKTIEACLILHRLHLTGRAERTLIILPESLVHQWFIELLRRFNLWFTLFDNDRCDAVTEEDPEVNPFLEEQLVICSIDSLLENEQLARCAIKAEWDMLVVDEAHHLEWTPESASPAYQLVKALAQNSHGLLLLTATPEQLGVAGHFARLRLLDPDRYPDLKTFESEQADYAPIAVVARKLEGGDKLSTDDQMFLRGVFKEFTDDEFESHLEDRKSLLKELVDRHGTGRVIFRNTRDSLSGFPERKALPHALGHRKTLSKEGMQARLLREFDLETGSGETAPDALEPLDYRHGPRIRWLASLLRKLVEEKVLLICRTQEKVQAIHDALSEELYVKAAVFHEGLSLLQRDRNAAWFAEPDGAQLLLCSEIGSEGRNFQFAHHLVLFDLPLNPELLEQRIGRLDRIGQTETIRIHLPYLKQSCTELLMRWHHKGLDGVEHSLKGGYAYLEKFGADLIRLGPVYHEGDPEVLREADELIKLSCQFRKDLELRLREGQDCLIALNSFKEDRARKLVKKVRMQDADRALDHFMNRVFDHFGVTVEDLNERTVFLSAGQLFTDSFPGLSEEGMQVTYDRKRALGREDIGFLTWDHPMVRGSIDLVLSTEKGNSSMVVWAEKPEEIPPVLIEAVYILESVAPARLHVDRFLPPTPVRVLVDMQGKDYSEALGHSLINKQTHDEESFHLKQNPELLRSLIPEMLKSALNHASKQKSVLLESAITEAHARLDREATRLKELRKLNPNVQLREIEIAETVVKEVIHHISKSHLRLDSVRLILESS